MVQTSNSANIPFIDEDHGYCVLVKQIINRFFLMPTLFERPEPGIILKTRRHKDTFEALRNIFSHWEAKYKLIKM